MPGCTQPFLASDFMPEQAAVAVKYIPAPLVMEWVETNVPPNQRSWWEEQIAHYTEHGDE